jgi:VCBS repeat-containing protein
LCRRGRQLSFAAASKATRQRRLYMSTSAPTTTVTAAVFSADTGISANDFITNVAAQTVVGTLSTALAIDERVQVSLDGGSSWSDANTDNDMWSFAATLLGSNTLEVRVTNDFGNGPTYSQGYTLDTTAPTLAISSSAAQLRAGETATITFTFSEDPGASFNTSDLTVSGGTLSAISGSGLTRTAVFTPAPNVNGGTAEITVAAGAYSDAAGNAGGAGASPILMFDTQPPAAPSVLTLNSASDAGASHTDGITNVTTPIISGISEAGEAITLYDTDRATVLGSTVADGSGNWSITTTALTSGAHSFIARAVDIAGNLSVASNSLSVAIDTTAPAPPVIMLASASDSATIGDGVTKVATPTFTGTAEANAAITLYDTDGVTVLASTVASNAGVWAVATSALAEGSHALTAKAIDVAGNISAASSSYAVTIDKTAPANVTFSSTTATSVAAGSGATIATLSSSDITAVTYALVAGDGLNDADNASFATVGNTLHVGGSPLAAGTYHIYLSALDAAGNVSQFAQIFTVADAPTVTSIVRSGGASTSVAAGAASAEYTVTFSDSVIGVDISDFVLTGTGTATGTIAGVSGSGSTYTIQVDGLSGDGTLRLDLNTSGTSIQSAAGIAIAGGYTAGASYTLDHSAPAVPSPPVITTASDSGTLNDGITSVKTPTLTGTSEAHATVTLYDTDGTTVLGTATADGLGHWSITSTTLSEGVHILAARAVDVAGNVSATSGGLALAIDTTLPSAASITHTITSPTAATILTETVTFSEVVTGVTASAFTVHDASGNPVSDVVIGNPITTDGRTYLVTVSGLAGDGAFHLDLKGSGTGIQDLAGNIMSGGATGTSVTFDHAAPAITLALSADTGLNNHPLLTDAASGALVLNAAEFAQALRFGGTVSDANLGTPSGAVVTITAADGHAVPPHVVPLQGDGTYAFRVDPPGTAGGVNQSIASALTDGTYTVVAYTQDAAGNIAQTAPTTFIVDTTADVGSDAGLSLDGTADRLINADEARTSGFTVSGLDADATAVATFTDGTHTVTANVTADGTGTVDLSGLNGTVTSSLAIADVHQNVASVVGGSVLIDTLAPLAPTSLTDFAIRNGFVNTAAQALTGVAEAGSTITVYDGATVLGTALADATTGRWTYALGALVDGQHALSAVATDLAGNIGTVSSPLAFTVDTQAPAAPNLALTHDTGVSATDGITRDGAITLAPSEVGGTLTYTVDGAIVAAYDPASLAQGAHTVAVTQTDAAGNVSTAASLRFTLDTLAPTAPTLQLAHDTGVSAVDALTHDGSILVSQSEAGGTLSYVVDGAAVAAYNPSLLAQGAHTVAVTHTDGAGNVSAATSLGFTLDSIAPSAQADTLSARGLSAPLTGNVLANDTDTSPLHLNSLQFGNGPAISTPTAGTAQVAGEHGILTITSNGSYSYQATSAGHDVFTETVMDAAGNASQTTLTLKVDHTQETTFRFFDTKSGGHFFTASADEAAQVRASMPSFTQEGIAWTTPDKGTDTVDVFRFYDTKTGDHFFTADVSERDGIIQSGSSYHYEGVAFEAFASEGGNGTAAVERFFNVQTGQHHYALAEEADGIRHGSAGGGWVDEGKAFVVQVAPHDLMA